ncbi:hypothetical protein JQ582_25790 [Bradyrhizobium japonicum]|uniref:hypothetical protein n=1 Tax=Bradyrhizobium TaxID=374 RepID=UPI0004146952|nr:MULTISPECIES: hypothetical protein [Bradyrhizobium]MBR0747352.1 hypothetical protein [Bradyrhizobium japonicum]MBR0882440.1 hypothetical protein [Bradyrhizobium liaoningense]MBR1002258.1 hypothetical protein [Bradyrhizobium liaoningense]MBR1068629.1 hypothetical protein [Bradyrhizobium liaoningense]MCP1740839.1 hypothetical protein [Bradyrhizobium japonicum]
MTLELVHSSPTIEMEQRVLRMQSDALILKNEMTKAQARAVFLILQDARDNLSRVIDRAEWDGVIKR